ncbi:hypothetical protein TeGR_g14968 [Tetraparma gracilis]|uniref:Uncharacterized protein n=1 Tax=Tetraparma gracilis TaxID=2962635 RepID=A0ABQ6N4Z6_9STRA|nr:hypothetical protein TeGR_g14968 [Tetraparma gracilis]
MAPPAPPPTSCLSCLSLSTFFCSGLSLYLLDLSRKQPRHRLFLRGFAASWLLVGTARVVADRELVRETWRETWRKQP